MLDIVAHAKSVALWHVVRHAIQIVSVEWKFKLENDASVVARVVAPLGIYDNSRRQVDPITCCYPPIVAVVVIVLHVYPELVKSVPDEEIRFKLKINYWSSVMFQNLTWNQWA